MQRKLERKAFEQCKLYYKLRWYKSSLVIYDNFEKDFPDSKYRENVAYLRIETSFELAEQSIRSVQEERYKTTVDHYLAYVDKYPESKFLKEAEKFYAKSITEITKFATSK